MLDVEYRPAEIYLARIEIRPDHQGGGIGTRLISALIDEADQKVRDLVLDVLTVNRRAHAIDQRLGMTEAARHDDANVKITMRSTCRRRWLLRRATGTGQVARSSQSRCEGLQIPGIYSLTGVRVSKQVGESSGSGDDCSPARP